MQKSEGTVPYWSRNVHVSLSINRNFTKYQMFPYYPTIYVTEDDMHLL